MTTSALQDESHVEYVGTWLLFCTANDTQISAPHCQLCNCFLGYKYLFGFTAADAISLHKLASKITRCVRRDVGRGRRGRRGRRGQDVEDVEDVKDVEDVDVEDVKASTTWRMRTRGGRRGRRGRGRVEDVQGRGRT